MYQQPRRAPAAVKTAGVLICIEAGLGLVFGALLVVGALLILAAGSGSSASDQFSQALGGATVGALGGVILVIAIVGVALSGFWLWVGISVFRVSNVARWIAVVLHGLMGLIELGFVTRAPAAVVYVALTLVILYCLLLDPASRAAFAALTAMPPQQVYGAPVPGQLVGSAPPQPVYPTGAPPAQHFGPQQYSPQQYPPQPYPSNPYPAPGAAGPPGAGGYPSQAYPQQPYPAAPQQPAVPPATPPLPAPAPPPPTPGPSHTDIPGHAGTPPPV